jgi:PPK2 family polyphosphate:nucleotide phosphotransferase
MNVIGDIRIRPGTAPRLAEVRTDATLGIADKEAAADAEARLSGRLSELQALLAADGGRAVLIVLQGMDASGKDGVARALMRGLNPMIVDVHGFSAPTPLERRHDFLWRIYRDLPPRGEIGIFNRSHYEDVLIVRVEALAPEEVWRPRFAAINAFEERMAAEGTVVLKFMLHISPEEQLQRLRERAVEPFKRWKYNPDDFTRRAMWDAYMEAYEEAIALTSTEWAPWHVVPADRKWVRNVAVLQTVVDTLGSLDLPEPPPPQGVPPYLLNGG